MIYNTYVCVWRIYLTWPTLHTCSRESATVSGSDKGSTSHTPSRQPISPTPSPNSTSTAAAVSSQPATPAWTSKASPNPPSTATVASGQTITPACTPNRSPNGPPLGPPLDSKLGSSLLAHVSDSACKARSLALPDAAVTPLLCAECAREGGGEGAEQEGVGERTSGKGQAEVHSTDPPMIGEWVTIACSPSLAAEQLTYKPARCMQPLFCSLVG
eukprot:1158409-Pelagomonas_calceolata.AAC.3